MNTGSATSNSTPFEFLRQEDAAHIDHEVEIRPPQLPQTFRKLIAQVDVLIVHRTDRIRSHCRRRPGRRSRKPSRRCHTSARIPPPSGCGRHFRCRRTTRASGPAESQFLQKQAMHTVVFGQFRVERRHQMGPRLDQHRIALILRQHLDPVPGPPDNGRPDEHGLQFARRPALLDSGSGSSSTTRLSTCRP